MATIAKNSSTSTPAKKSTSKAAVAANAATVAKAKPASRTAAKKAPATPASKIATPASTKSRPARTAEIHPDQRRKFIEVAAYYIAERRGFTGGTEAEDWATAEAEIELLLSANKLNG